MMQSRRSMLKTAGAAAALALAAGPPRAAQAGTATSAPIPPGKHPIVPLPFIPAKLTGISARMIESHHDNNYAGAVKNLNKVEEQLAAVTKDTPGFLVAGLRERELTYTNSLILHEHYFGNLGGNGKPTGALGAAITRSFGSLGRWEELFRATAMSLGGGSGWVVLDHNLHTGDLRTYGSGGHTQALAFGCPLLVLDMYEHAYAIDYGAAHAKYIDAFFANVNWDIVSQRLARASKL